MTLTAPHAASRAAFLNALLREWSGWTITGGPGGDGGPPGMAPPRSIAMPLPSLGLSVTLRLRHWSPAGRHAFEGPLVLNTADGRRQTIDLVAFAALVAREESIVGPTTAAGRTRFLGRLLDSLQTLDRALDRRRDQIERLFTAPLSFIEAEQALILGHPVHPTPRSHDEFSTAEAEAFAPEFAAAFPLTWFLVDRDHLDLGGSDDLSAETALSRLIASDPAFPAAAREEIAANPDMACVPMHPWQARHLLTLPAVAELRVRGKLVDLGPLGSDFKATTSLRTVYAEHAEHMLKFSLSVRVTNSVRVLLRKEWERGKQIHRLLRSPLWAEISARFPSFRVLSEPVHLALRDGSGAVLRESAVLFRSNPFRGEAAAGACVLATLCQDHPTGGRSRLAGHVDRIAAREAVAPDLAARRWFDRFLEVALRPLLMIQADYGLLFGAHQQNTVLGIENDYPARLYYRDCQGTGQCGSALDALKRHLPEIGADAENTVDDALGRQLFGYYLIVNNIFNVIASLGGAGLTTETELFVRLRAFLEGLRAEGPRDPSFLDSLLNEPEVWSKGNFLTCLRDINESHEGQEQLAVYRPLANPIAAAARPVVARAG